ncbi:hypothetical protein GGQ02_002042 [Salinibacter ruber]|uniref:hypothetical protein n=1 Tax=Salinibacter ruber TaxID=146919 RepID=UPI000E5707ED|nr:hypothetical protein [Salinibacter ruber]MCS4033650.1 hypothetical protein [Salinibacter ruber]
MSAPQPPAAAGIQTLFWYTRGANARMLDAMQAAGAVPARAMGLFGHLLRVQDVWFGRVEGTAHADLAFWVDEDLAACAERAGTSGARWQSMLEKRSANALD